MSEREHVEHYAQGKIETIDYIFENFGFEGGMVFILSNVIKYASRAFYKEQLRSDLEKIRNYMNIALEKLDEHEASKEAEPTPESFGFTIPPES